MAEKAKVTKMVLTVDLQCRKCYKKVQKLLCKFQEIQDQVYDEKNNTVTIEVVCCCPEEMRDRLYCKGRGCIKKIEIVKPPPPPPPPPPLPPPPPTVCLVPVRYCCTNCCNGCCRGPCYNPCYCYGRLIKYCGGNCGRPTCDGGCGGGNCGRPTCDGRCGGVNCGRPTCDGRCGGGNCGRPTCDGWCGGGGHGGYCGYRCRESACEQNSQDCTIM